jgi:rfaE bifunctional protein kinase chain/domain
MNIETIFQQFKEKRIAVIGDVMLDAYMIGTVTRISPEAPVPIVGLSAKENRLGGAANVALNIVSLGAEAIICSVIGADIDGNELINILEKEGVNSFGLLQSDTRKTTVKTRIIGNNQQLLRIDSEQTNEINNRDEINLLEKIDQLLKEGIDAVIFEDYNKGVLTQKVINEVIRKCNDAGIPTTVDPKKENFFAYKNCTLFKPNLKELKEGLNVSFSIEDKFSFENAVHQLNSILNNRFTFITLSEHGVYIQSDDEKKYIPAHIRTIADVSGAGDTVISVATLCLCVGLNIEQVASFANLAGGLVCEKSGVVSIEREQLMNEIRLLTKSEIL